MRIRNNKLQTDNTICSKFLSKRSERLKKIDEFINVDLFICYRRVYNHKCMKPMLPAVDVRAEGRMLNFTTFDHYNNTCAFLP